MADEPAAKLAVQTLSGGTLNVEFHWSTDRFAHLILIEDKNRRIPVLSSVEGQADHHSVPSPCLTELHEQDSGVFLTGATKDCFWSLSAGTGVTRLPSELKSEMAGEFNQRYGLNAPPLSADQRNVLNFLFFDVACRIKRPCEELGSHYRIAKGFESLCQDNASAALVVSESRKDSHFLEIGANRSPEKMIYDPAPDCSVSGVEDFFLRVDSTHKENHEYPATLRWSYAVWLLI